MAATFSDLAAIRRRSRGRTLTPFSFTSFSLSGGPNGIFDLGFDLGQGERDELYIFCSYVNTALTCLYWYHHKHNTLTLVLPGLYRTQRLPKLNTLANLSSVILIINVLCPLLCSEVNLPIFLYLPPSYCRRGSGSYTGLRGSGGGWEGRDSNEVGDEVTLAATTSAVSKIASRVCSGLGANEEGVGSEQEGVGGAVMVLSLNRDIAIKGNWLHSCYKNC
ncbi:hypothetical protein C8R45DRAFT_1143519 [Mycena sanguinolenta]|nr:hypothetical protein C8R45DRAFT_1143519 [Mycena sanguinolenta]